MELDASAALIAITGALATIGILAYQNRREIERLKDWAFGSDREYTSDPGGMKGDVGTAKEQMSRIEQKLDDEMDQRIADHKHVEQEIKTNRYLAIASMTGLVEAINDESEEFDLDVDSIQPDWVNLEDQNLFDADDSDSPEWGRDHPPNNDD